MTELTNQWIQKQRSRSKMAAMVDIDTFKIALDGLENVMARETKLREALKASNDLLIVATDTDLLSSQKIALVYKQQQIINRALFKPSEHSDV